MALYFPFAATERKEYYSLLNRCAVDLGILGISFLLFGLESAQPKKIKKKYVVEYE